MEALLALAFGAGMLGRRLDLTGSAAPAGIESTAF
jgi:hypothetical protein